MGRMSRGMSSPANWHTLGAGPGSAVGGWLSGSLGSCTGGAVISTGTREALDRTRTADGQDKERLRNMTESQDSTGNHHWMSSSLRSWHWIRAESCKGNISGREAASEAMDHDGDLKPLAAALITIVFCNVEAV